MEIDDTAEHDLGADPDHGLDRFEQEGASLLGDEPEPVSASGPTAAEVESEAPLALYRRYRPETFADVIGQEHVTEPLARALTNNRVNHAYLFSGPRGCGKTTSARILARCLNCEKGPTPTPCGECQSCRDLARGGPGSIDVIEIDAASHGGVEDARDLRERAIFAPVHSRYKVYIVDEAHMVTPAGFNALLKLVEEPPPHVKFVFATTEPDKVIGTIRSRTHHYPFRLVPPRTLTEYLGRLCEAEGVQVDRKVLPLVVRAGAGSVRDSLSVLDQLLGGADAEGVSYDQAAALLGFTPEALLDEVVDAFAAGDGQGVFAAVDRVIEVGQDPRRFGEDLLRRFRDLVVIDAVPDAIGSGLVDVPEDQAERMRSQAASLGLGEATRAAEVISSGLTAMRGTTAPRLHLELMCARVLLPGADVDERGLHARLDRLERRIGVMGETTPGDAEPAQSQPAAAEPAAPEAPAASAPPAPPEPQGQDSAPVEPDAASERSETSHAGGLRTAEFRQLWPQVLERVKQARRFTHILLSQNAHVAQVNGDVLTLALHNQGARESFQRGGSEDVLREAIIDVVGVDLRIDTIVEGGDGPGGGPGGPGGPGGSGGSGGPGGGARPAPSAPAAPAPAAPPPPRGAPGPQAHAPAPPAPVATPPAPERPAEAEPAKERHLRAVPDPPAEPETPAVTPEPTRQIARATVAASAQRARERLAMGRQEAAAPAEDEYADFDPADLTPVNEAAANYRELLATHLGAELVEESEH